MKAYTHAGRLSSCEGKSEFTLFREAARVARRARRDHEENLQPYRCKFCDKYHIGVAAEEVEKDFKRRKRALREGG